MESKKDSEFRSAAVDLSKAIADRKITLVYGKGVQGLQDWVAVSTMNKRGRILGISL